MSDNPSFVLNAIENVSYEERPIPDIADNDVLVKVHYLVHGRIGDFVVTNPMVLGHESAGIVHKVGSNVKNVSVGDRVAVEPGATCRTCEACKSGRYELCPDIIFAATPPYDGTLCRYYRVPSDLAYPLPEGVSLEDGAMYRLSLWPVGVHSVANLGGFRSGQSIIVFGCGPVGLLCMAVAKALGASRIIARLDFAKNYAATDVYLPLRFNPGETKLLLGVTERGKNSLDLVIDASGAEVSIQTGFQVAKSGGIVVQVGMGTPDIPINMSMLYNKELNYKGSFRYGPGDYPLAIQLVAQGKIDLKPLVTHRFSFQDALVAFNTTKAGKSADGKGVIKAIISGPDISLEDN
ncbi:xylitol dehydrogenase [Desarmillaria tabescens]|uniref:Xylitol dehydrogenase n=1 Tax=Armillaria tabescens TaxID=1929756 RepID=A0AA39T6N3_ARMTA|nr:xylitol dehydrogenase [Desarmillaria tabescens]KAK0468221.1 xylitol dehydrogenase [Desarmillaria tabescens]